MSPMFLGPRVPSQVSSAAAAAAAHAEGAAARAQSNTEALERRVERLALVAEALWGLLQERVGLTEQELLERVQALDLSDGYLDGKVRRPAGPCPGCGRMVASRHRQCLYCGADTQRPAFTG